MTQTETIISADWIFTNVGKPIKNGGIKYNSKGEILAIYCEEDLLDQDEIIRYEGFIVPGFINAHGHLELSYAFARLERGKGINAFISRVEELKKQFNNQQKKEAIDKAMLIMEEEGIVAMGDICNTNLTTEAKRDSKIRFRNFVEVYGLDPSLANSKMKEAQAIKSQFTNSSIVPHSTYSVSEKLFSLISKSVDSEEVYSIHNQESEVENLYFKTGDGEMVDRFKKWNLPIPSFVPSGKSPMETIKNIFKLADNPVLFVHNTFSSKADIKNIISNYPLARFCLCPSSNLFIENQLPEIQNFEGNFDRICLGTDSLASNDTISILHELKILSKENDEISLEELFKWSGINGAKALGFTDELGSFEIGKKPGIILIMDVDTENQKFTDWSWVQVIKPAGTK